MSRTPTPFCKINDKYTIQMTNYGWTLLNSEKQFARLDASKHKAAKITNHPTLQQLCEWVINREAGMAEDFKTLLEALNAKSDWLRIELEKDIKK